MLLPQGSSSLYDDAAIYATRGTQLLGDWSGGDEETLEKLFPPGHPELHRPAITVGREPAVRQINATLNLNM